MDKHICANCYGRGYVTELPPAPAVRRDLAPDYRDVACRLLDKLEREGWRPDEVAAMTARVAELDATDLFVCIDSPEPHRAETVNVAERIYEGNLRLPSIKEKT